MGKVLGKDKVSFSLEQLEYLESLYAEQTTNADPNELYIRLGNRQVIKTVASLVDKQLTLKRKEV